MSATLDQRPPVIVTGSEPKQSMPRGHHLSARLLAALCLTLAVLAGLASLTGVVQGTSWFPALIAPVFLIHASAGLLRGVRGLTWSALPIAALIGVISLSMHEAMNSAGVAVNSLQWFSAVVSEALLQFGTQVPPVAASRYVEFSLLLLAVVLSLLIEVFASFRRLAPLVIAPLCIAPIAASLFKQEGAGITYLVLIVLGVLGYFALLPYIFQQKDSTDLGQLPHVRQLSMLGVTALICVVAMVAVNAWMPGFRKGMLPEGIRPSGDMLASNVDPFIDLGRDLRTNNGSVAVKFFTNSDTAPYLRTAVIDDLTQNRWKPSDDWPTANYYGNTGVVSDDSVLSGTNIYTRLVWDSRITDPVLPMPDRSYYLEGIQGSWNWIPETSIARLSTEAMEETKTITVAHTKLNLTPQMARTLGQFEQTSGSRDMGRYLSLPEDPDGSFGQLLQATLAEAAGDEGTPENSFERAVQIQDFLRSRAFGYSERTPLREGYDGANRQVVSAFLERRQGYCVHFASTMALMARAAGIPSRIAVGYAPGDKNGETQMFSEGNEQMLTEGWIPEDLELTGYQVTGKQAHAWPELYIDGIGWVPFEPTPGRGQVPAYAPAPTASAAPSEPVDDLRPTRAPVSSSPTAETSAPVSAPVDAEERSTAYGWYLGLGILLLGLVLAIAPWRRSRLRHQRLSTIRPGGPLAAQQLWTELQALGADSGNPAGEHESVSDYTLRLAENHPRIAESLNELRLGIQASFYADRHPAANEAVHLLNALEATDKELRLELGAAQRVKAYLFPASLRLRRLSQRSRVTSGL